MSVGRTKFEKTITSDIIKADRIFVETHRAIEENISRIDKMPACEHFKLLQSLESEVEALNEYANLNRMAVQKITKEYGNKSNSEFTCNLKSFGFGTDRSIQTLRDRIHSKRLVLIRNSNSETKPTAYSKAWIIWLFIAVVATAILTTGVFAHFAYLLNNPKLAAMGLHGGKITLEILGLAYLFSCMAVACDSYLMPATELLSEWLRMSDDLAGVSLLAMASAAPEIVISCIGILNHEFRVSMACVMGSGIIGFGLIPAVCILGIQRPMSLNALPVFRDLFFYAIILITMIIICTNGSVSVWESGAILILYAGYILTVLNTPDRTQLDTPGSAPSTKVVEEETLVEDSVIDIRWGSNSYGSFGGDSVNISESGEADAKEGTFSIESRIERRCEFHEVDTSDNLPRSGEEEEESSRWFEILMLPFSTFLSCIVPDLQNGNPSRCALCSAFFISFLIVALLSEAIMVLTADFSDLCDVPREITGILVLAIGAQVPDTLESYSMAKCGKANGAMSNAFSSQILNIVGGIALPYFIFSLVTGAELNVNLTHITTMGLALGMLIIALVFMVATGCRWWRCQVVLDRTNGLLLLGLYVVATVGCTVKILLTS
ncbi:hypothetical protein AAMO2058_000514000 [Amorphochlora amoebiformis]